MLPHLLTNFEIQKYYHNEPKFNAVYLKSKPFIIFLEVLLPFQISSEDNNSCNSNNYSYKLVNYLFLKLAWQVSMIFM